MTSSELLKLLPLMNKRRNLRRIRNLRRLLFRALLTNERSLAERILIYPRALCQSYPLSPYSLIAPVFRALDKQLPRRTKLENHLILSEFPEVSF